MKDTRCYITIKFVGKDVEMFTIDSKRGWSGKHSSIEIAKALVAKIIDGDKSVIIPVQGHKVMRDEDDCDKLYYINPANITAISVSVPTTERSNDE